MGDFLRRADDWLSRMQSRHMASRVELARGAGVTSEVPATRSRSTFELVDGGVSVNVQSEDFLISPEDYTFDGIPVEPKVGDLIRSDGITFEVTSIAGTSCFEFTSAYRNKFKVHTQIVKRMQ